MKTIKFILRRTKKSKYTIFISVVLLISLNYIRSLVPLLNAKVFGILDPKSKTSALPDYLNQFFNGSVSHQLIVLALLIVGFVFTRDVLNFIYDTEIANISETVGTGIQTEFYTHVQDLPYSYLNRAETGDLIQRSINDVNRFKGFVGGVMPNMLNSLVVIIIFTYQMFRINAMYTIFALAFVPILFLVSFVYFKRIRKKFVELEEIEGQFTTVVQENLTGIRVVKAFANEKYEVDKFQALMKKYTKSWADINRQFSVYWGFTDILSFAEILFAFVLAVIFAVEGFNGQRITLEEATGMFLLLQNILWPVRSLGRQISEMTKASIAIGRIDEILQIPTEYHENDLHLTPALSGGITFDHVSFQFNDATIATLKDVNFTIQAGETIALVGRTGSGKSTLVGLLNRMLDTTTGTISVDGNDIKTMDKHYLRSNIGIVMQEPFLYSKTVEENIAIVNKEISKEAIQSVAKIASVHEDIQGFEKGYATVVGERGVTLSGGQKQRIAIARVLTKNKPILVFDDSLSAVDSETDMKIRKALNSRQNKSTTIIITHRTVTARGADRIFVMNEGTISDIGTHDELIKRPGLYQNIHNIQNSFSKEEHSQKVGEEHV